MFLHTPFGKPKSPGELKFLLGCSIRQVTLPFSEVDLVIGMTRWANHFRTVRGGTSKYEILWMGLKSISHRLRFPGMMIPVNTNKQMVSHVSSWCRILSIHSRELNSSILPPPPNIVCWIHPSSCQG